MLNNDPLLIARNELARINQSMRVPYDVLLFSALNFEQLIVALLAARCNVNVVVSACSKHAKHGACVVEDRRDDFEIFDDNI